MSNKPVEVPKVGFNEALQRIAKFDKDKLPDNLKQNSKEKTAPSKDGAVKVTSIK
jgi:hypothetical protein